MYLYNGHCPHPACAAAVDLDRKHSNLEPARTVDLVQVGQVFHVTVFLCNKSFFREEIFGQIKHLTPHLGPLFVSVIGDCRLDKGAGRIVDQGNA